MHKLEDLDGFNTARALAAPSVIDLTLSCPSYVAEGVHRPAESFQMSTRDGVRALRDLCDELLTEFDELNPPEEGDEGVSS